MQSSFISDQHRVLNLIDIATKNTPKMWTKKQILGRLFAAHFHTTNRLLPDDCFDFLTKILQSCFPWEEKKCISVRKEVELVNFLGKEFLLNFLKFDGILFPLYSQNRVIYIHDLLKINCWSFSNRRALKTEITLILKIWVLQRCIILIDFQPISLVEISCNISKPEFSCNMNMINRVL